jgi:small-conductance mechanosensitive channel
MQLLEDWRTLLLPEGSVQGQDLWQILVVIALFALSCKLFGANAYAVTYQRSNPRRWLQRNRVFLMLLIALIGAQLLGTTLGMHTPIFRFFAFLGGLWLCIGLLSSCIPSRFWAKSVAAMAYAITAILSLSLVDESVDTLHALQFTIGTTTMTGWGIFSGILTFVVTLWLCLALAQFAEVQMRRIPRLSASLQVLIAKVLRIVLIVVAAAISLTSMGVNLSALTVLGGAVGLGLGFGLQKVVSNFISGILLLIDNSIKPGDMIEVDGTYGKINNLRARYISVITRDGSEHLIPNEDLITQRVVNWTYSNNLVRIKIPVSASYDSDPHQCIQLVVESAQSIERILSDPAPAAYITGFGDSALHFELRCWIADPSNGVANIKNQVLLNIWDAFKANDIVIPYPQLDLHINSSKVPLTSTAHTPAKQD